MPGIFRNSSAAFISLFMAAKPFRRLWVSFSAASFAVGVQRLHLGFQFGDLLA